MDESLVWEDESSIVEHAIDVPKTFEYVGAVRETAIPDDFPKIYLDYAVAKRLQEEGQRSIRVNAEVGGILLGTTTSDGSIIKISHIAIGKDEDSSPVHYKFSYSVWDDLIDQMEAMSQESGEDLLLVGWYHTHPNMAVFLSRYDLRTHRDFHRPYQFALVLAPQAGTDETPVGFFVNRRGSTPLLPGLRLYGAPAGEKIAAELPWRFQEVEAEGVEEGEDLASGADTRDQTPVVHQLGVVRREDPNWLLMGLDKAEGPVLPILEAMAATVVETGADRIGVLLGTKTSKNHITIHRVRFLGKLGASARDEREEILGTLRFMAQTFPAHGEAKILGLVRIVSPHRFEPGDLYDPLQHNIQVAELLGEVGYDLSQVPFQVGLVLYPGIEEDGLFFQVFAQNKTSRPVPLMSMRAMAPEYMRPNERYECVEGYQFIVEDAPSMSAPVTGVLQPPRRDTPPEEEQDEPSMTAPELQTLTVLDPDLEIGGTQRSSRVLVGIALAVLVVALGAIAVLLPGGEEAPDVRRSETADGVVDLGGEDPYLYSVDGCGARWNPGLVCTPFAGVDGNKVPLVRVEMDASYASATFSPLDGWLRTPTARMKLVREKQGDALVFSVARGERRWDDFWGNGDAIDVRLVLAPRGAELEIDDELTPLRRVEAFRISVKGTPKGTTRTQRQAVAVPKAKSGNWTFEGGVLESSTSWDGRTGSFSGAVVVRGGAPGNWSLRVSERAGGTPLAESQVSFRGARTDLSSVLAELMETPAVASRVAEYTLRSGAAMFAELVPAVGPSLQLRISVGKSTVQHRVCVMMQGPEGLAVPGRAQVNGAGMRPTFSPNKDGVAECADGGATGRWTSVTFGPGRARVDFVPEGGNAAMADARDRVQSGLLGKKWSDPGQGSYCLGVTVMLNEAGVQTSVPRVEPLYAFADGSCR